jgi:hypothetical protein
LYALNAQSPEHEGKRGLHLKPTTEQNLVRLIIGVGAFLAGGAVGEALSTVRLRQQTACPQYCQDNRQSQKDVDKRLKPSFLFVEELVGSPHQGQTKENEEKNHEASLDGYDPPLGR